MASRPPKNPFEDLGAEPADDDFSDLGAEAVSEAPSEDFADLGAEPVEAPEAATEKPDEPNLFERFYQGFKKRAEVETKVAEAAQVEQAALEQAAAAAPAPEDLPERQVEIRQAPAKRKGFQGLVDSLKKFYRPGETTPANVARAQLVRELSQEFDLEPSYVEDNIDELARKKAMSTGVYTQPTNEEVLNAIMLGTLPIAAAISGPIAVAKGIASYTAIKEGAERVVLPAAKIIAQKLAQEPIQYEVTKLRELVPDVGPLQDVADLAEFVIYGIGAKKATDFLKEPRVAAELAGLRFRILKALGVKQPTELVPLSDAQIQEAFGPEAWKYLSKEGLAKFKTEELAKRGAGSAAGEKPVEVRVEGPAPEAPAAPAREAMPAEARARELGREAFAKGMKRVPALDPGLRELFKGKTPGEANAVLEAWTKAWDEANLAPEAPQPEAPAAPEVLKKAVEELGAEPVEAAPPAKPGDRNIQGLAIKVEHPAGSTRTGKSKDGKEWSRVMANDYGYIRSTTGKDGEQVDVFLGPNDAAPSVFVVDQVKPDTGKFDEHKAMVGFDTASAAKAAYLANYPKNFKGYGGMTEMPVGDFKEWVDSNAVKKPAAQAPEAAAPVKRKVVSDKFYTMHFQSGFTEAPGAKPVQIGEYDAFVHRSEGGGYVVSEAQTGLAMGRGRTKVDAVSAAKKAVDEVGEKTKDAIEQAISKTGLSPRYEGGAKIGEKPTPAAPTQKERVKKVVADEPKSIKKVAEETGIVEPNIRRILGVGAKDGTFRRVDEGVYVLNKAGEEIAYIYAADAVKTLPKLAKEGLKVDMIFLDIPYNTAAVRGGNRGVKYSLISTAQFRELVKAIGDITRDENTPVYYMYSQAPSGLKQMLAYNNVLISAGFKPIAEGEYQKTTEGGEPVKNMRGDVIKPEKIVLLNKSGIFNEKDAKRNLDFKLVRPKGYQTEKPAALLRNLIMQGTKKGETVLDPFAGSGVTPAEAVKAGRKAVAIEINEDVVKERILPRVEEAAGGQEKVVRASAGSASGFPPRKPTEPPKVPEDAIFTPWDMPMRYERPSGYQASTNAPEIIDALAEALKKFGGKDPIRVGRFKMHALGVHYTNTQVIRIKTANDILTAAHEVGHALEQAVFGYPRRRKVVPGLGSKPEKELLKLGKILYGSRIPNGGYIREGFAEFLRMWVSDRRQAKLQAPLFYDYFEKTFLPKHQEGSKALDHVRELFNRWQSQGSAGRAKASIVKKDSVEERTKGAVSKLKKLTSFETHVDMLQPLKKLTDDAQEQLHRNLLPDEDPFFTAKALRLTHDARTRTMVERYMIDPAGNPVGGPLKDITALVKGRRDDFTIYLWAKRAEALWLDPKRGKSRNPGLSLKDAEQIIKELETPTFKIAAQKVYDWNEGVLNYAAQSSSTFAEAVEKIRERDPGYYLPLQREFRELDSIVGRAAGRARARSGNVSSRLKGSGRRILDPFPQMISNARNVVKAAHNRMVLDQMIRLSHVQGMGHLVEKVQKDQVPAATKTVQELLEAINKKLFPEAGVSVGGFVDEDTLSQTITFFMPAQFPKGQDPIIPISNKGEIEWYQIDREIYDALAAMEVYRLPSVGAFPVLDWIFGKPARIFRAGTTGLRATFGLVMNPLRDLQTLYINSQSNVNALHLFGAWMKSMANAAFRPFGGKPDPYLDAFIRLGGEMAQPLGQDISHTQRAARQLFEGRVVKIVDPRNWLDWFRDLVQFPESAGRVAELRTLAKEVGWEPGQPMTLNQSLRLLQAAKEVTTDFTAAGEFGRVMNQMIPFYNASIQGPRANIRAGTRSKKHARRFILRGLALTAATLYLWNKHKDEDWYKEMDARERFGYWHFPIDWPDRTLLRLPRAFEIGMIFSALPEALLDAWYRQDPKATKEWMKNFYDLTNPLDYPVLIRELISQAANKDLYWETPIVPRAMEQKPEEEQFNEYTTKLAITLGDIFNVSPRRLDHAINGIFGAAAGDVIDLLGLGPKGIDKEGEAADLPVIGKLFQRGGEIGHHPKSVTMMYDLLESATKKQHSDKVPETKQERELRLMLTDAARAVSIIQYVRSQTPEAEKREELSRQALKIARNVIEKYRAGRVSRGEFKGERKRQENIRERVNEAKEQVSQ